jgi:thioesterase domain-containing protein/acyl carrier protein
VAPGDAGELLIGGEGLARGYLKRPDLTAEKFVPDIFAAKPGGRLYRTGDEVRRRPNGTLEFLGRMDHQVKLRGFRIELGEIESALARIEGIRQAVVIMREDRPGDKRLVAYFTATDTLNPEAISYALKATLPSYMVPSIFLRIEKFPLTPNGKLDRKALPSPNRVRPHLPQEYVAARTPMERKLASIWMELLNLDQIGINDDFYDLGGDSLLAVRAMSQVQETFGVFPNMQAFFPSVTIANLAKVLTGGEHHDNGLGYAVTVQPDGTEPPLFWIGAGLRSQQLSAHLGSNQPFIGIGIEPKMIEQLHAPYRLEELAEHLVVAIRAKQPHGPYRLGGFCQEALIAYEIARQLMAAGETVELLALLEPEYPRQSVGARIATKWKRKLIRANFHLEYLKHLKTSTFSENARTQLVYLKEVLSQSLSRSLERRSLVKSRLGPSDFSKINSLSVASYKPTPLGCPTAIFRCRDWPFMSAGDPYFGWRELLTGGSETYEVPGDHEGIFHEPNVKILAAQLQACLRHNRVAQKSTYEVSFDNAQSSS